MRPIYITMPLSIILAGAGVAMLITGAKKRVPPEAPEYTGPKHPVSAEMATESAAWTAKKAPEITLTTAEGKPWSLHKTLNKKPAFVYFVLDGCPCSIDAEPLYHRLYNNYKDQIDFVGVISSDQKVAADWVKSNRTPYTMLVDKESKIAKQYKASRSVYSALIAQDGTVVKMWPGYSKDMLTEANKLMAKTAGVDEKPYDPAYAPKELSSGCELYQGAAKAAKS